MGLIGWGIRHFLIWRQRRDGLAVDPELLAGRTPGWAIATFWFLLTLLTLPFALWLLLRVLPEAWVIDLARSIWRIRPVDSNFAFLICDRECPDLVFGMIALPAAWLSGVCGAIWAYRITARRLVYQQHVLRIQPGPVDRRPAIDALALRFRSQPFMGLGLLVAIGALAWFLPRFVGEVHYDVAGQGQAYTNWRFAYPCATLGLAIAATGALVFFRRRAAQLSK